MSVPSVRLHAQRRLETSEQWAWVAVGLLFAFLIPFVFADLLELPRDLYYGVYAVAVTAFLGAWARSSRFDLRELVARNWRWGLALGLVAAGAMALIAIRSETATVHPDGLRLVGALLWRGVVYGAVDGLLLSVFPILAVFTAFRGSRMRKHVFGTVAVGALALVISLATTASYHLGYPDFRSQKVTKTLIGDTVWSAPTLLTLSPLGAPIAHIGLHVSAVVHSYDTDLFLPPH